MMNQMPFRLSLFVLFLATFLSCETEGPENYKNHFIKYYGADGDQEAKDFVINDDGTIVMLGTFFETNGDTRLYVVKSDHEGNQIWAKKLGSKSEFAQDIKLIRNGSDAGNLVLLSNVKKNEADSTAISLIIINQAGDSLKSKVFDFLRSQRAKSVTPLEDGGFYVGGNTTDTDAGKNTALTIPDLEDAIILKFESNWDNYDLEQIGSSSITAIVQIMDEPNALIFASYSDELIGAETTYESNFIFRKIENNNEVTISVNNPTRVNEFLTAITRVPFGEYLAIGTQQVDIGVNQIFLAKINSSFSTVLNEGPVGPETSEGVSVTSSSDGSFWILGNEVLGGGRNIWVGKISSGLSVSDSFTFGGVNNDDTASAIKELDNGDLLILGTMELVNQKKMALIKIKPNGSF
jgi:hypothetical protein